MDYGTGGNAKNEGSTLTDIFIVLGLLFAACVFVFVIILGMRAIIAKYHVWSSSLAGEAELKKAEWNRQIIVREAQAKRDSASMLAQAEIERAKGVAQANKIIGDSLHNNENYLRYLWIDSLDKTKNQVIYVPTETNLPLLEASRNIRNKNIN